jgi:hypothetical protein
MTSGTVEIEYEDQVLDSFRISYKGDRRSFFLSAGGTLERANLSGFTTPELSPRNVVIFTS